MKRTIGFLMMVGLMVGIVGCGDDNNPVKEVTPSNQDLLVGTWLDEDGDPGTFKADGTFVDPEEDKGKWSLVGDQLTITYDDPDLAEFNGTFTITVTDTELTMTDEDGEIAVFTRQTNQDLLVGTWLDEDGVPGTFRSDGTFVDDEGDEGTWSLVGDQLTIAYNDEDYGSATVTLNSVTDTELTFTDEDGERVVFTRKN